MSVHVGISGKKIILTGRDTTLQKMHQVLVRLGSGRINCAKNPGWNDVLGKQHQSLVQISKSFNMARRKRASAVEQPIGVGLTTRQMKRKKPLSSSYLVDIESLNDNQKRLFDSYKEVSI